MKSADGKATAPKGAVFCQFAPPCPKVDGKAVHSFVTITYQPGREVIGTWCPGAGQLVPAQAIRQAVTRRLPVPAIGSAPGGGVALTQLESVLWVSTAPSRALAGATLLGHRVAFKIAVQHVTWDFGDGATAAQNGAGRAYDPTRDPCRTKTCPGYFGHIFTTVGHREVTATVSWQAWFSVDGGGWAQIGQVDGYPAHLAVTVREARAVLVPTPR